MSGDTARNVELWTRVNAEYTRERFVYDLDRLMKQTHPSTLLWDPADPAGEQCVSAAVRECG